MTDRIPTLPGEVLITPKDGGAPFRAVITQDDEPEQLGTAWSKANVLTDPTAIALGLDPATDPTPNDAFFRLSDVAWQNAGAHNSIYRGKFLGNAVTPAQRAAIQAGTFEDLYVGDYWEILGYRWRIADFNYYMGCGSSENTLVTANHAVIVPDTSIGATKRMNASNITTGGYMGSEMRGNVGAALAAGNLTEAIGIINQAFPGMVMQHEVYLTNAVTNGYPSGGAWCQSKVELMNEEMVYGSSHHKPMNDGATTRQNHTVSKSQLSLFQHRHDLVRSQDSPWVSCWLRDVVSASRFAIVGSNGYSGNGSASNSNGVRPAFSIS